MYKCVRRRKSVLIMRKCDWLNKFISTPSIVVHTVQSPKFFQSPVFFVVRQRVGEDIFMQVCFHVYDSVVPTYVVLLIETRLLIFYYLIQHVQKSKQSKPNFLTPMSVILCFSIHFFRFTVKANMCYYTISYWNLDTKG